MSGRMLQDFIHSLRESADYRDILGHYHYLPEEAAAYVDGDAALPPEEKPGETPPPPVVK